MTQSETGENALIHIVCVYVGVVVSTRSPGCAWSAFTSVCKQAFGVSALKLYVFFFLRVHEKYSQFNKPVLEVPLRCLINPSHENKLDVHSSVSNLSSV